MTLLTTKPPQGWNDRFALDVALMLEGSGEAIEDVLATHKLTQIEYLEIAEDPVFQTKVKAYRKDINENGLTFRLKARVQAEDLLTTSYLLIHDPSTQPSVKADLIKATVKWAGYEPSPHTTADLQNANARGVQITINLGGAGSHPISLTTPTDDPLTIEGECKDVTQKE